MTVDLLCPLSLPLVSAPSLRLLASKTPASSMTILKVKKIDLKLGRAARIRLPQPFGSWFGLLRA